MKSIFLKRFFRGLLIFTILNVIYFGGFEIWLELTHEKPASRVNIADLIVSEHIALSDNFKTEESVWNQNDDILPLLTKELGQLEFVKSKVGSWQTVLEANYRVSGNNAHLIEDILHKEYGMSELKFACCGWESHPNGNMEITDEFNNKYEELYDYNSISISMYSDETLIQERDKWHKIPYFNVVVRVSDV